MAIQKKCPICKNMMKETGSGRGGLNLTIDSKDVYPKTTYYVCMKCGSLQEFVNTDQLNPE